MNTVFVCSAVSIIPLRKEPSHLSEQVSQLLYGERALILEAGNRVWVRVKCSWDGYEGWCLKSQLAAITKREYTKDIKYVVRENGGRLIFKEAAPELPVGAELPGASVSCPEMGRYKGKKQLLKKVEISGEGIRDVALHFLYSPYQWGGRTHAGIDCSGFTQMVYKLFGIPIPRDASQQALQGVPVDFLQNAVCGDLAFFSNESEQINHTGLLLDSETIIHAAETSGKVVIDKIDNGGIISRNLRKRTHQLRLVRRYAPPF